MTTTFTLLGLIFLVLGLGMGAATLLPGFLSLPSDGEARLTFGIIALTFVPIGLVFSAIGLVSIANARRDARLGRIGLPGRATVEAVSGTNMLVNGNPMVKLQLAINVSGRSPYSVSKRATVPPLVAMLLTPGATVPVRVDPEDPDEMRIEWNGLEPAGGPLPGVSPTLDASGDGPTTAGSPPVLVPDGIFDPALRDRVNTILAGLQSSGGVASQVLDAGTTVRIQPPVTVDLRGLRPDESVAPSLPGRATVQAFTDTGVESGDAKLYTFDLEVRVADRAPYTVKHAALLDRDAAARLFRGASYPVSVDASDGKRLAIEWGT